MAIFFDCGCSQPLRADEDQVGGTQDCPACGHAVPVPSIAVANLRQGIEAVPPLELSSQRESSLEPPVAAESLEPNREEEEPTYPLAPSPEPNPVPDWHDLVLKEARGRLAQARRELDKSSRPPRPWSRESHWFQCLAYPFRAWPILAGLSFAWATLLAILVAVFPSDDDLGGLVGGLVLLLGLLIYTCAFFRCVFLSGVEGEAGFIRWPGRSLPPILWSGAAALLCFLAGPMVPGITALLFWRNSGDLEVVDYFILWDLGLAAAGSWYLALLTVWQSGRLRDANPAAWIPSAWHLDWRGWLAVTLAAIGTVGFVLLTLDAVELTHLDGIGWLLLLVWSFGGSAWVVFLLRWYGLSRFHGREAERGRGGPGEQSEPEA